MARHVSKTPGRPKVSARSVNKTADISRYSTGKLSDYIIINSAFVGFCVVQLLIVRVLMGDFAGIYFFFGFFAFAFLLVSVIDYFANRVSSTTPEQGGVLDSDG